MLILLTPDFDNLTDEQKEIHQRILDDKVEGYIDFQYEVNRTGATVNVEAITVSHERLQFYVPFVLDSINATTFMPISKRLLAPIYRMYFLIPNEKGKSEDKS